MVSGELLGCQGYTQQTPEGLVLAQEVLTLPVTAQAILLTVTLLEQGLAVEVLGTISVEERELTAR